ncbi:hypothetical protein DSO57_1016291 [Entomophthora muscae]|uniref:Uncharacterized protein n=1 Tax=Entomophthora muscae TaxID=34485 RepID=A0ACC2T4X5_9FUNG|nr:hypothetical protein DSO57_1016291 [Entomophthora muscae]
MAVGDIITVTKEVDEGWWVGEIGSGPQKRSGMFPVNYTELVKEVPSCSSGDNEAWIISGNSGPAFADPEEAHDESPRPSFRRTSTASSSASSNQVTPNHSFSGPPQSNGVTFRESAPARPSGPKPGTVAPSSRSKPPNRTSYMRPPGEAAANMAAAVGEATNPTVTAAACRECGCDDFSANVFKKGSCNNCFHAH